MGPLPAGVVYGPEEQRMRLSARLFDLAPPPTPTHVPQLHQQAYEDAVESFLAQHPFLDGSGEDVSSAVFSADLMAFALHADEPGLRLAGEAWAERSTSAPNPFLIDFYEKSAARVEQEPIFVTPEHVGLLDASVRARLRAGQQAALEFAQEEGGDGATVVLEVVRLRDGVEERIEGRTFRSSAAGTLRLTRKVANASVQAEDLDLDLGDGQTGELAAPILFDVCKLTLRAKDLMVSKEVSATGPASSVGLFAREADTTSILKPPRVADGVTLRVQWPGATAHPWNRFAATTRVSDDPLLAEAQRSLRRLVVSFRSHSKGQLARFKDKIEHRRMTKGDVGDRIRESLLADHVLSVQGVYYVLDPDSLGRQLDTDYASLRDKAFSEKTNSYLTKVLSKPVA
jgi:hypothetical protein